MHLLLVTEGVPTRDPLYGDGSSMISFELIRHLPPEVEVTLVAFGDDVPVPAEVQERCRAVHLLPLRNFLVMAARSVLLGGSLGTLQRSGTSSTRLVRRLSHGADVTLLHGPHVASLASAIAGPLVLQVVDPWSSRATMEAEVASGPLRLYRRRQARRSLTTERRLPPRARLLTVGRDDAERWSRRLGRAVGNVANGVDGLDAPTVRPADAIPTACFVGSLNYAPNIDSVEVLAREIAPEIWRTLPTTRFVIAGRHPVPAVTALQSDLIEVKGNVASVLDVFRDADVAVFPDRQGLGVRNSVSEALAAGLPVVASPTAAREQPEHPRLLIGKDVPELVALLRDVLTRPRASGPVESGAGLRDWPTAAREYHDELLRAIGHPDRETPPPAS